MTQAVSHILKEVEKLSASERTELADCIVEYVVHSAPADVSEAQIREVQQRVSEVESGKVALIPGKDALEQVRQLAASAKA